METLIERSRKTVDDLIARRYEPRTYEEKVQHALDVVSMHLQEENPDRIDECIRLYTEDAVWEAPARLVSIKAARRSRRCTLKCLTALRISCSRRSSAGRRQIVSLMILSPAFGSSVTLLRIVHCRLVRK